ncbi:hypothetical protein V6Z11_D12G194000 [Gossypium hirsutum]
MKGVQFLVAFVLLALASKLVSALDPSPLQDFCVAINDTKDGVFVNGKFCKDPKLAKAEDFYLSGLNIPELEVFYNLSFLEFHLSYSFVQL